MFKLFVEHSDLSGWESKISTYIADTTSKISDAEDLIISMLHSNNRMVKQLCVPFNLTINTASTTEEKFERMRLVMEVASADAPATSQSFVLKGRNSDTEDWSEALATITYAKDEYGVKSATFKTVYKYYIAETTSTIVPVQLFLVETTFDILGIYCALWLCYSGLIKTDGDIFTVKSDKYESLFRNLFSSTNFNVDIDESGEYEDDEEVKQVNQSTLSV